MVLNKITLKLQFRLGEDILIQCIPNNQTCANRVAIELFQLLSNTHTCAIETSTRFVIINSATVSVDNPKVIFTKLKPGYYCVHVRPLGCQTDCARYSKVIILQSHTLLPSQEPEIGESLQFRSKQTVYIVCAIISVIIVCSIIGIFLQRLKKKRSEATTWEFSSVDSSNHIAVEGNTCREIREVTILYTQETPEILNCIIALVQFIQKCCDVVVRFDINEEATVRMNPIAWYGRGDLFILVETAGAVYREEGCLDKKEIYHIDEDSLDSYYLHSFMRIVNNPDSVVDYSKYIVVRFSYTPKNIMFKTVALNKRYVISQHLAQLCNFLSHGKDLTPTTENLLKFVKKWEDTSEYQNLSLAIERANRFVSQNTNYVQSVLKERIKSY